MQANLMLSGANFLNELKNSIYISVVDQDPLELIRLHLKSKTQTKVKKSIIKEALGPSSYKGLVNWQIIYAQSTYRPDVSKILFDDQNGTIFLNTYSPPDHLNESYWELELGGAALKQHPKHTKSLLDLESIPKPYYDLFCHLTCCEGDSLQYLIDWMSVMVDARTRNITTLTLLGKPGAGKGLLFEEVLKPLVGDKNGVLVKGGDSVSSRFNASYLNKRLIMLDEVKLRDPEAIDRFKTFANPTIEIEQKGKDPIYAKNWANTIVTSNSLDSIYIEPGDRRFSIIQLTDTNLETMVVDNGYENIDNYLSALRADGMIKSLYDWLIEHTPSRNMNIPFKAETKTADVKSAGFAEWEQSLIEYLNQNIGGRFWLSDVQETLTVTYNVKHPPGRSKVKRLFDAIGGAYKVQQDKKTGRLFIKAIRPYVLTTSDELEDK